MGKHEKHSSGWTREIAKRVAEKEAARVKGMTVEEAQRLEQALKDEEDFPGRSGDLNG